MLDPTSQVTVGGALLLVIFMLLKYRPWRNSNSQKKVEYRATTSGEQAPGYWTSEIRKIMDDAIEASISKRNEQIKPVLDNQQRLSDKFEKITDAITLKVDAIPGGRHIITDKLDKMTDAVTANRSVIIEKLDKIIELLLKK